MKKFISLIVSVVLIMLTVITASAAEEAFLNVTLVSETEKDAVVTVDFNRGVGFSAMDMEFSLDDKRVSVVSVEEGKGFANFSKKSGTAFAMIGDDMSKPRASFVTIEPFRVVDGKDLLIIKIKKLSPETLSYKDFNVEITNYANAQAQELPLDKVSVTTDLQGVTDTQTTSAAVVPSEKTEDTTTQATSATKIDITNDTGDTIGSVIEVEKEDEVENGIEDPSEDVPEENGDKKDTGSDLIIIAVVAVVFVAVVSGIAVVVMKKKKTTENEE